MSELLIIGVVLGVLFGSGAMYCFVCLFQRDKRPIWVGSNSEPEMTTQASDLLSRGMSQLEDLIVDDLFECARPYGTVTEEMVAYYLRTQVMFKGKPVLEPEPEKD